METKHTKGVWEVNKRALRNVKCNGLTIANCSAGQSGDKEEEEVANAKLISTVPELLETIYHGLRLAKSLPNKESIGVRMFIKAAEKVLKKALT
jgi:hypothetical protein